MTELILANSNTQYLLIEQLADTIWKEHYTPIIGIDQVNYMLKKFQTAAVIETQIAQNFQYYIIMITGKPAGYLSIKKDETSLFLSKIYVLKECRGQGIGKAAMAFVEEQAKLKNCHKITLTVNKHNTASIKAYEKIGFINTGVIVQDIGSGYVMDDYTMEKSIGT